MVVRAKPGRSRLDDPTSKLRVTRQRRYQLRHIELGLCTHCTQPADEGSKLCVEHRAKSAARSVKYEQEKKALRKRIRDLKIVAKTVIR